MSGTPATSPSDKGAPGRSGGGGAGPTYGPGLVLPRRLPTRVLVDLEEPMPLVEGVTCGEGTRLRHRSPATITNVPPLTIHDPTWGPIVKVEVPAEDVEGHHVPLLLLLLPELLQPLQRQRQLILPDGSVSCG